MRRRSVHFDTSATFVPAVDSESGESNLQVQQTTPQTTTNGNLINRDIERGTELKRRTSVPMLAVSARPTTTPITLHEDEMEYNFIDEEGSEDEGNEDEESNGKGSEDEGIHANCTVEDNPSLLGSNLKEMDQELRRSLTNLTFTPIEDPYDNMEALKSKLVGRDELEIYRMKKLKKQQEREGKEDEVGEAKASSLTSGNYSK